MMTQNAITPDEDDLFNSSTMTFGEHGGSVRARRAADGVGHRGRLRADGEAREEAEGQQIMMVRIGRRPRGTKSRIASVPS